MYQPPGAADVDHHLLALQAQPPAHGSRLADGRAGNFCRSTQHGITSMCAWLRASSVDCSFSVSHRRPGEHHDGVRPLRTAGPPPTSPREGDAARRPATGLDVLLAHQAAQVEQQLDPQHPLERQPHQPRHVPAGVNHVDALAQDQVTAVQRSRPRRRSGRGDGRSLVVPQPVPVDAGGAQLCPQPVDGLGLRPPGRPAPPRSSATSHPPRPPPARAGREGSDCG